MAYVEVENTVETMLKTAFTTGGVTQDIYGAWIDDSGTDDRETRSSPHVQIIAAPNIPYGWHEPRRRVPVTIEVWSKYAEDPTGTTFSSLYHDVRQLIDETSFSHASFTAVAVYPVEGGSVLTDGYWRLATIQLDVEVCVAT